MDLETKIGLTDLGGLTLKSVMVPEGFTNDLISRVGYEMFNDGQKMGTYVRIKQGYRVIFPVGGQWTHTTVYDQNPSELYLFAITEAARIAAAKLSAQLGD